MVRVHNYRSTAVDVTVDDTFTASVPSGARADFAASVKFDGHEYKPGPLRVGTLLIGETTSSPPEKFVVEQAPEAFVVMAVFVMLGAYLSVVTIKGAF